MKKAILIVLMALMLVIPAYAAEGDPATDQSIQQEQEPVVVATLEELQTAIDVAEDGDTIILSKKIILDNVSLICKKDITIKGIADSDCFFSISGECELSGLKLFSDCSNLTFALIESGSNKVCNVKINGCQFIRNGNNDVFNSTFLINIFSGNVEFKNCEFLNEESTTLSISSAATVNIENCFFTGTHTLFAGGAINNSGHLTINNTEIVDNSSGLGGAIYNDGSLTISSSIIRRNIGKNEFDVVEGNDIYSRGVLTITDEQSADEGFYEETTGEKLALPLMDYTGIARLTYLTEEEAAEYFPPEQSPEGEDKDNPAENPDNTDQDIPQKPEQPPEQPIEPPKDNATDDPADTIPDTPQQPQEPADGGNDYTPPVDYRPSQRPTRPSTSTKPTGDSKPQEQPDIPAITKPQLACNGAVIDTSRTVVLLGYGDGLPHEDDPLTRAQLATIIYRLLDDESVAKYSNARLAFADVAADAWYTTSVKTIQAAGIVNGVGNGRYDPNGKVTWSQILAVLSRFVEQKEYTLQHIQYSGWAQEAIQTAVALNWIEDRADFTPDAVISRGELVQLVNSVLELYRA